MRDLLAEDEALVMHERQRVISEGWGQKYLLAHRLNQSADSGQLPDAKIPPFLFPPGWHFNTLAALDYFQACRAAQDERLQDALDILQSKRNLDGT